jgi:hypothetical protein
MDLGRKFEKFRGGPTPPPSEKLHVTLGRRGNFFFNKNAHRIWGKPLAVYLYYSPEDHEIALVPTIVRATDSFPVREKNGGWTIQATPFCRHFGIRLDGTEKFIDPVIQNDGKMILNISRTMRVSLREPRKRNRAK